MVSAREMLKTNNKLLQANLVYAMIETAQKERAQRKKALIKKPPGERWRGTSLYRGRLLPNSGLGGRGRQSQRVTG